MRSASGTRRSVSLGLAVAVAAFAACGNDEVGTRTDLPDAGGLETGGVDSGSPSGDAAVDADAGPVRAPFGLDARPSNTTCLAPARPPSAAPVKLERVFANVDLGYPVGMTMIPGDPTRWFSISLDGLVKSFPVVNPPDSPPVVLDLKTQPTYPVLSGGESGLLGIAFHPKFAQNGQLYVSYGTNGGPPPYFVRSMIARFTSSDNGASFGNVTPIIGPFDQPASVHMAGTIMFGPDGFLYGSFGDGGQPNEGVGQRKETFFSKLIRIDVDSPPAPGLAYAIPDGNPWKAGGGEAAAYAYGFRNPFRFTIDRATGDVWVGDVGDGSWEEVDIVRQPGGNYGYPCREGAHDLLSSVPAACPSTQGLIDPDYEYSHGDPPQGGAIVGGYVYRGKAMPWLVGTYLYADYTLTGVFTVTFDPTTGAPQATQINTAGPFGNWTAFAEDLDGEVYVIDIYYGAVYKLVPNGSPPASTFPDRLSKTGCVDPKAPTKLASGVIPFAINAPLWSDGAEKERGLALPDGAKIGVGADGDFDLPKGSVLVKTFSLGGKRIETRLLVRHDDGDWAGYSYEWLDDQSDAVLLASSKTKALAGGQKWSFPSRSGCIRCHTAAAGRTLGLELGQLNRDFVYGSRISNELATLDHIGLFQTPLAPIASLPAYPDPLGTAPLESRARAYLHANCSMCHRPGAPGRGDFDVRFATTFATTKLCNATPTVDSFGIAGAKLLAPGSPATSILSYRPHQKSAARMPPLGSLVVDDKGVGVVDDWIKSIATCPP